MNKSKITHIAILIIIITTAVMVIVFARGKHDNSVLSFFTFKEDNVSFSPKKGYNANPASIYSADYNINNILVSYSFLKDNVKELKEYLDNGSNILIRGENITSLDVFETFHIPDSNRAFKTSKSEELNDIKAPLKRHAILIFKYNSFYYAPGYNSSDENSSNFLMLFKYNKNLIID